MNSKNLLSQIAMSFLLVLAGLGVSSQTLASGVLTPKHSHLAEPQIKSHDVRVVIANGYAITEIDQVFYNPNSEDIEAIYSFPIPEKASVGEFTYWIDDQPITGEVIEAKQARQIYETEKSLGHETALVEQNSYLAFESSVYPVKAQQQVRIRLVYVQPVHVDSAIGRYVYPMEEGGTDEQAEAFWQFNKRVEERFSFHLTIRSGYPIEELRLPNHSHASITRISAQEWTVEYLPGGTEHTSEESPVSVSQPFNLDQDLVLYWRLASDLPGAVDLVTYKAPGASSGTFMLTLTPGADLDPIQTGRDWIFVLDFSGSMSGKYASLVHGMQRALGKLSSDDRFRIFLFNQTAWEVTNGFVSVTPEAVEHFGSALSQMSPDGSTNLYKGLEKGLRALDSDRTSGIILVTDGVANVGVTEKVKFLQLLEQTDVRLFTMIMGNGANRPLLEAMTQTSQGFAMNVSNGDDIYGKVLLAAGKLTHLALRDIDIKIKGVKTSDLTPEHLGSLYHGQQLTLFGKYYSDEVLETADMTMTGKIGSREVSYDARLSFPGEDTHHPELERLWAYATIEHLQSRMDYLGESADIKQALVDVAVSHGLVTNYTSMIVVRDERFAEYNLDRNNQRRVEMERDARSQRAAQPLPQTAQQTGNGFSQPRAYPGNGNSGGGSVGIEFITVLLPLLLLGRRRKGGNHV